MKRKIFRSSFAGMLITAAAAILMIAFVLNNYFVSIEKDQIRNEADLAVTGVEQGGLKYLQNVVVNEYRLTWIDKDGTVLYDSKADASTMENHADRSEVKEALLSGRGESERISSTLATRTIYYAERTSDGTVIRISVTRNTIWLLLLRMIQPILWILIITAVLALFLSDHAARSIAAPLNKIDLDHPLRNKEYPELEPFLERIDEQNNKINQQISELHARKKEFITATSSMREALMLINKEGKLLTANPSAEALFHLKEDYSGKDIRLFVSEDLKECINQALNGREVTHTLVTDDAHIHIDATPILSHGQEIGVSVLGYDITKEYAAEIQRQEFTANVSHELKTPLQTIMGSAELLENHLVKEGDEERFLTKIRSESARLLVLIDDIIRLSELDENSEMKTERINLAASVREVQKALIQSAESSHVTLHSDLKPAYINANSRLIYEIIYNLMDNAIRYNHDPGSVRIMTCEKDARAWLVVQDTGIGIPHEAQEHVFERFYRVDKSRSRATGGTGLGLSIVKHAVSASKGKLEFTSIVEKGSTFTVSWKAGSSH